MSGHAIVLTTANARYSHSSLALRWLWTNLGPLRDNAVVHEFDINQQPLEIVEAILTENPRIVGVGVYIWNVSLLTQVVTSIKRLRPDIIIVLGGPEACHEYEGTPLFKAADHLIRGEGDLAFAQLARDLLAGNPSPEKVIEVHPPDLASLELPYAAYTDEDIAHRAVYVETSRGCPFRCEFCLSALDQRVRTFPLEPFFEAMEPLLARGARRFRFVDRTFNLDDERVIAVLDYFRARWREGMQIHVEIVPDRLSERVVECMAAFPPGGLHLEVGVQTFTPEAQAAIGRRQDIERTEHTLRTLRTQTGVLLHADLIVGLPGEDLAGFASGFDRLIALEPHEIQVGFLKRLKGGLLSGRTAEHRLVFADYPPYEVLETPDLAFIDIRRLKRFARYLDLFYNSGNFPASLPFLWQTQPSPFKAFMAFSEALWTATGKTHRLSLTRLAQELHRFLVDAGAGPAEAVAAVIEGDFRRVPGRKDRLNLGSGERPD